MQISVVVLKSVLAPLAALSPKHSAMPALENILFEPDTEERVKLRVTDLTCDAVAVVATSSPVHVCIPIRPLLGFIAALPKDATVELRPSNKMVTVSSAGDALELPQYSPRDYPKPIAHTAGSTVRVDVEPFVDSLQWVARAVGEDETRPNLIGVLLENDRLVATDGHRLHVATVDDLRCPKALISASAASFLVRALRGEIVTIDVAMETVRFETANWSVTSKQLDQVFPPYEQVIPDKAPKRGGFAMRLIAKDLAKGLKRVAKHRAKNASVRLRANGAIKLDANNEHATSSAVVNVIHSTHVGPDHVTGFNPRYLADALDGLAEVELRFHGAEAPAVIDDGTKLAVIMPMRI